jgi:hypothetical protein
VEDDENDNIGKYVENLRKEGHSVHWPYYDTNQDDPVGTKILLDNSRKIFEADEIHFWFDKNSSGSHFDLGVTFALLCLGYKKKIVFANRRNVKIEKGKKSFPAVIRDLAKGNRPKFF